MSARVARRRPLHLLYDGYLLAVWLPNDCCITAIGRNGVSGPGGRPSSTDAASGSGACYTAGCWQLKKTRFGIATEIVDLLKARPQHRFYSVSRAVA